jgi:[acyl-carrier-protein] S-malonyltransferase
MKNNKVAFVFPGQGSQAVGMLADLAAKYGIVGKLFAEAAEILDYDLWKIVAKGPLDELNKTIHTQPALLVADIAVWHIWQELGGRMPSMMAGHSLGEYAALVVAGALGFDDAVSLVAIRARIMQDAVPAGEGAMAVILGLPAEQVMAICEQAAEGEIVEAVNFNSPGQTVIAGDIEAVERAMLLMKEAGARRAKLLPVSVPSHCQLMKTVSLELAKYLEDTVFRKPQIPVISNADVSINEEPAKIKLALIRQLYNPVRWIETIEFIADKGVKTIVECGPGKILNGLNKRIAPELQLFNLNSVESFADLLT